MDKQHFASRASALNLCSLNTDYRSPATLPVSQLSSLKHINASVPLCLSFMVPAFYSVNQTRFNDLDFARAFLLSLGLVLHAAFLCRDRGGVFQGMFHFIHSFRMEGFFLIAGFFSAMALTARPPGEFLKRRLERLGIPWLFSLLALTLVGRWVGHTGWGTTALISPTEGAYHLSLVSHLWFLRTLIVMVSMLCLLVVVWPGFSRRIGELETRPLLFLGVLASTHYIFTRLDRLYPAFAGNFPDIVYEVECVVHYAPWFAAGYYLFHHQKLLYSMVDRLAFNSLNVVAYLIFAPSLDHAGFWRYGLHVWEGACIASTCGLVLWIARKYFIHPTSGVRSLAKASYTIYILHWPIMLLLFEHMAVYRWPAWLLFSFLMVSAGSVSFAIHKLVVQRFAVMAWLMNGIPMQCRKPLTLPQICQHPISH